VCSATDGAANMQGQYKGFSAFLSEQALNQIHVWCYAHILNLVLLDTTGIVLQSASLFGLLNDVAVFLNESYKRMQKWHDITAESVNRQRRLCPIGQTRRWAKDAALRNVFGCFGKNESAWRMENVH